MRNHLLLITLLASLGVNAGCVQTECGPGTIDRDGVCAPANEVVDPGICGDDTKLVGTVCVPKLPPTECDPETSTPTMDPETGIIKCIGTGVKSCSSQIPCQQPAGSTKLTICGQLYDYETGAKFAAADPTFEACDPMAPTTSGPCALTILAFDALVYGNDQTKGNVTPTGPGDVYIDDCGRYRVSNIETSGTGPYIGLGFTEAGKLPQRPLNQLTVTATTGVATLKPSSRVVSKLEGFIVKPSTIMGWEASMGPPLSGGIYVGMFRAHKAPSDTTPQAGVKYIKGTPAQLIPSQDYYFKATETTNTTIDPTAAQTGMNGGGLLTGANVNEGPIYTGTGGITDPHCTWETHAAANLANIVFFQIYRKTDVTFDTTPCGE